MSHTVHYFSPDYVTARTRFRQAVENARGQLQAIPLDATGPHNEELTIDIGWLGSAHPKRVLLHSSGIHGVEAFAGSAIQLQVLDNLPELPGDTALILTHVLNPYGMAWLRRHNETNVDLNRNFLGPGEEYAGAPEAYSKLDSFLNPRSPPSSDFYHAKVILRILRYGYATLAQTIAGGQYEFSKGFFFGGKRLEQGPEKYQRFLAQRLASAEQVIGIDVHTGLGKYGEDTLLAEDSESIAYRVRGGIGSMISRVLPDSRVSFVTQEFGTYSGVTVLHALREENRFNFFGSGGIDHPAKQKLKEAFYPNDDSWRLHVLKRGREFLNQVHASLAAPTASRR
jgi:hypothetical protein